MLGGRIIDPVYPDITQEKEDGLMEQSGTITSPRTAFLVAAAVLIFAIGVLVAAYDFSGGSGIFPRFVGWVFILLSALEVFSQLQQLRASKSGFSDTWVNPSVIREVRGFLWVGFFLVVIYLLGFMIGVPVYLLIFWRFSASRSWKQCLLLSAGATFFIYLLFLELLEYRLYSGVLFGA